MIDDYDLVDWHSDDPRPSRTIVALVLGVGFLVAAYAGLRAAGVVG